MKDNNNDIPTFFVTNLLSLIFELQKNTSFKAILHQKIGVSNALYLLHYKYLQLMRTKVIYFFMIIDL